MENSFIEKPKQPKSRILTFLTGVAAGATVMGVVCYVAQAGHGEDDGAIAMTSTDNLGDIRGWLDKQRNDDAIAMRAWPSYHTYDANGNTVYYDLACGTGECDKCDPKIDKQGLLDCVKSVAAGEYSLGDPNPLPQGPVADPEIPQGPGTGPSQGPCCNIPAGTCTNLMLVTQSNPCGYC